MCSVSVNITMTAQLPTYQCRYFKFKVFKRETCVNTVVWLWAMSCNILQAISDLLRSILCTSGSHN